MIMITTKHGQVLLPSNLAEDGAIYVNAKQYRGILRRRQSRAKAEMKNKAIKVRKVDINLLEFHEPNMMISGAGGQNASFLESM